MAGPAAGLRRAGGPYSGCGVVSLTLRRARLLIGGTRRGESSAGPVASSAAVDAWRGARAAGPRPPWAAMGELLPALGARGCPGSDPSLGFHPQGPVVGRECGDSSRSVLGAVSTAGGSGGALESILSPGGERLDRSGREWAALEMLISAERPSSSALVSAGETRIALDTAGQPSAMLVSVDQPLVPLVKPGQYRQVPARAEKCWSALVSLGLCLSVLGSLCVSVPEAMRCPGGVLWELKHLPSASQNTRTLRLPEPSGPRRSP